MAEDRQRLRQLLAQLKAELSAARSLDPAAHEHLSAAVAELEQTLADDTQPAAAEEPLSGRLEDLAAGFESSHPALAGTLGSIINALARMGI